MKSTNSITFSSDTGNIKRSDLDETSKMTEEYFGMEKDPDQMPATKENRDWLYEKALVCINLVRDGNKIIGYTFLLPCSKMLMDKFLNKEITEAKLAEAVRESTMSKSPEAIYLCASIFLKEYRGQGLATSAFKKQIDKFLCKNKPILFYEAYSVEGKKLAERVAKVTGLPLKAKIS